MLARWPGFLLIIILLIAWELVSLFGVVSSVSFPRVTIIFYAWFVNIFNGELIMQLLPTLRRVFTGFLLATAIAIPMGLLMGGFRFAFRLFEPITEIIRPIPVAAFIPVAILFLGIGDQMKLFVISIACYFPIVLNTYGGVLSADPVLIGTGRTFGLSRLQTLRQIVFPASLPSIFTGMRIGIGIALIIAVVAEMIAGNSGIGYFILDMQRAFKVPEMFCGIFTLGVIGYLINYIFVMFENYVLRWRGETNE